MGFKVWDYECQECGYLWEQMLNTNEEPAPCPECHTPDPVRCLCAPNLAAFSISDKATQVAKLKERSEKHTRRMTKREEVDTRPKKFRK